MLIESFKKYIPNFIKFPGWYLFKAPQRKLGWYTLLLDIKGILSFCWYSVFPVKRLEPISICVGLFNRSELFLGAFLPSLNQCNNSRLIELSVFDCGSADVKNLQGEIRKIFKGELIFSAENVKFSRSYAFNRAVKQSSHQKLFICDADFSIPVNLVQLCNNYTVANTAWFPIVFYLYKNKPAVFGKNNGEWMNWGGKGILACNKKNFEEVGMLDENFTTWGYEDEDLWIRFYKSDICIIRSRCKNLLHHWHPSLNLKYIKLEELADKGLL